MRKRSGKSSAYQEQVAALNSILGEMCDLAGIAMDRATQALLRANLPVAEQVITDHDRMTELSAKAEKQAFALLAQQAAARRPPRDRHRLPSFRRGPDGRAGPARRQGGAASAPQQDTARRGRRLLRRDGPTGGEARAPAREVLESQDSQDALRLEEDDDAMDDLHRHLFSVLDGPEWKHGVAAAVDVTLLGRYYERPADHAVLIGRRVVFQTTGMTPQQLIETT